MSDGGSKSLPTLGFLTILSDQEGGFCGGYLVLNAAGRPLEFHCTAAVKPNRAQEILYGPTLKPFLFGEQIGQTLANRSKAAPVLIVTDLEPVLAMRPFGDPPVVCIARGDAGDHCVLLGMQPVIVHRSHARDLQLAKALYLQHFEGFDLSEPFDRIREALDESRKAA